MIMSFAMMLKYSFDMNEHSTLLEKAVHNVLTKGYRTLDIKQENEIVNDGFDPISKPKNLAMVEMEVEEAMVRPQLQPSSTRSTMLW